MSVSKVKLYECGYCTHPEKIAYVNGSWKPVSFPAIVALIDHEQHGYILFDTGYGSHFVEAVKRFPYSVYAKLTPVYFEEEQSIHQQLLHDGIAPSDISYIVLSHFHGDHTGGLKDFPEATILTFTSTYGDIKDRSHLSALLRGCLKDTLPADLEERMSFIDRKTSATVIHDFAPFQEGYNLFGDGSLFAVDVTGHAIGQVGLFVTLQSGHRLFLCADAVWLSKTYETLVYPSIVANLLTADVAAYKENIRRLHQLHKQSPAIHILPTHCEYTREQVRKGVVYE